MGVDLVLGMRTLTWKGAKLKLAHKTWPPETMMAGNWKSMSKTVGIGEVE